MMDYPQTDLPVLILAAGQNRALCPLDRSAAEIAVGSGLDYVAERMAWRIQEGEQSAVSGFMLMASLAKHMPDMALNHARSANASKNAKAKAVKRAAEDPDAWMRPYFDAAWSELEEKGRKRIGHRSVCDTAIEILGRDSTHPDYKRRYQIGYSPAKTYWQSRRKDATS